MIHAYLAIKRRREQLGLTDKQVAALSGISVSEYDDIEMHEREVFESVRLRHLRRICEVLGLDLFELLEIEPGGAEARSQGAQLPRHELVKRARAALGLTRAELASALGFGEDAVAELESREDFLDDWPVDLILALSRAVAVAPSTLLSPSAPAGSSAPE